MKNFEQNYMINEIETILRNAKKYKTFINYENKKITVTKEKIIVYFKQKNKSLTYEPRYLEKILYYLMEEKKEKIIEVIYQKENKNKNKIIKNLNSGEIALKTAFLFY